jgi:copper chaperone CopZ
MRARALPPAALAVAVVAGGCASSGSVDSTSDFRGEQRLVAATVEDLESAASDGDEGKICRELLARSVAARLARGGRSCQQTVEDELKNADGSDLTVRSVRVDGTRARAAVKEDLGDADRVSTVRLVKESGRWRLETLG